MAGINEKVDQNSDIEDETILKDDHSTSQGPENYKILIKQDLANDEALLDAAKSMNIPVEIVQHFQPDDTKGFIAVWIFSDFQDISTHGDNYRILGRTALLEIAEKKETLDNIPRPLYCHAMCGLIICLTGYRKDEMTRLVTLIHHMGGSVRKEIYSKVTHLIARNCGGEKYQYAVTFRLPVLSEKWVYDAWERRNIIGFNAVDKDFINEHKRKPFYGTKVCFLGFSDEEKAHMTEILEENEGILTSLTDSTCTHLVVNERDYPRLKSPAYNNNIPIPSISFSFTSDQSSLIQQTPGNKRSFDEEPNSAMKKRKIMDIDSYEDTTPVTCKSFPRDEDEIYGRRNIVNNNNDKESECGEDCIDMKTPTLGILERVEMGETPKTTRYGRSCDAFVAPNNEFEYPPSSCHDESTLAFSTPVYDLGRIAEELVVVEPPSLKPVVDESTITAAPSLKSNKTHVVRSEWFWRSVQYEGRVDEATYKLEDVDNTITSTGLNNSTTPVCPLSVANSRARKRKRFRDRLPSFSGDLSPKQISQKRRSSASDATRISDGSFLDYTASPDLADNSESPIRDKPTKNQNARYHKFLELYQTEMNYVGILNTIMTLFKNPLEEMIDTESQLLNATEVKIIFGHLPPIFHTHQNMLHQLKQMASQWSDDTSIGNLFLKYALDLVKAYPPFINFFENTREMLINCDKNNTRFHAFLKVCQTQPECGRQSLQDLLIRPVQRLPSINLLLNDILRHTSKSNPDHSALESAISSIQEVMTHINEDKRKTEGQVALFDIFKDVENCPAHIVSSHRSFIGKCEVMELSDNLNGKGSSLALFLFSDLIEIVKRKKSYHNSVKSPKENVGPNSSKYANMSKYKHVKLLPLNCIKSVIEIRETEECHKVFALQVRNNEDVKDVKEKVYSFTITDENIDKSTYLRSICKQIATSVCRTDPESYMKTLEAQQIDIDSSDVTLGTLGRAIKFAAKTRLKVGRALSFNKTPSKIKRAVSSVMSPFNGNESSLTPSNQLATLQLAPLATIPARFWTKRKNLLQ